MQTIIAIALILLSIVALIFIKNTIILEWRDYQQWREARRDAKANRKVFENRNAKLVRIGTDGMREYYEDDLSHHSL